jgi:hypothetical protein
METRGVCGCHPLSWFVANPVSDLPRRRAVGCPRALSGVIGSWRALRFLDVFGGTTDRPPSELRVIRAGTRHTKLRDVAAEGIFLSEGTAGALGLLLRGGQTYSS